MSGSLKSTDAMAARGHILSTATTPGSWPASADVGWSAIQNQASPCLGLHDVARHLAHQDVTLSALASKQNNFDMVDIRRRLPGAPRLFASMHPNQQSSQLPVSDSDYSEIVWCIPLDLPELRLCQSNTRPGKGEISLAPYLGCFLG